MSQNWISNDHNTKASHMIQRLVIQKESQYISNLHNIVSNKDHELNADHEDIRNHNDQVQQSYDGVIKRPNLVEDIKFLSKKFIEGGVLKNNLDLQLIFLLINVLHHYNLYILYIDQHFQMLMSFFYVVQY